MQLAYNLYFILILELKCIKCIDLIVHTSLSIFEDKNETLHFVKTFEKNH
jgi:hypothetical protein